MKEGSGEPQQWSKIAPPLGAAPLTTLWEKRAKKERKRNRNRTYSRTEHMAHEPPTYAIWAVFIGVGVVSIIIAKLLRSATWCFWALTLCRAFLDNIERQTANNKVSCDRQVPLRPLGFHNYCREDFSVKGDVKSTLRVKSLCLSCEMKPPCLAKFEPNLADFSHCVADFEPILAYFEPILAKETPEFFDEIKAGEFTLNHKTLFTK